MWGRRNCKKQRVLQFWHRFSFGFDVLEAENNVEAVKAIFLTMSTPFSNEFYVLSTKTHKTAKRRRGTGVWRRKEEGETAHLRKLGARGVGCGERGKCGNVGKAQL